MLYLHTIYLCRCAFKLLFAVTLALVSEDGVCCKVVLPVKFKDPKFMKLHEKRHEALKLFIICLPSFFSIVEVIIELFVI